MVICDHNARYGISLISICASIDTSSSSRCHCLSLPLDAHVNAFANTSDLCSFSEPKQTPIIATINAPSETNTSVNASPPPLGVDEFDGVGSGESWVYFSRSRLQFAGAIPTREFATSNSMSVSRMVICPNKI